MARARASRSVASAHVAQRRTLGTRDKVTAPFRRIRSGGALSSADALFVGASATTWRASCATRGCTSLGRGSTPMEAGRGTCGGAHGQAASDFCQISYKFLALLLASVLTPPGRHAYTSAGGVCHI